MVSLVQEWSESATFGSIGNPLWQGITLESDWEGLKGKGPGGLRTWPGPPEVPSGAKACSFHGACAGTEVPASYTEESFRRGD